MATLGDPGSGKTTLATRLIEGWRKNRRRIAYVQQADHALPLDHPEQDTNRARQSGACTVYAEDPTRATCVTDTSDSTPFGSPFLDADMVLVESYKKPDMPKIVMIDREHRIIQELHNDKFDRVLLCAGVDPEAPAPLGGRFRYFQRDDISAIADAIEAQLNRMVHLRPLNGLILAGGQSRRMGTRQSRAVISRDHAIGALFSAFIRVLQPGLFVQSSRTIRRSGPCLTPPTA